MFEHLTHYCSHVKIIANKDVFFMELLTSRQEEILDTLKKLIAKNGYPPTVREIASIMDLNSPATIHFHLLKLEEKGYIKKSKAKNRCLELLVPNEYVSSECLTFLLPMFMEGDHYDDEKTTAFFPVSSNILPDDGNAFAVKAMNTKGKIQENDILIVQKCNNATDKDTVITIDDNNDVTIQKFTKHSNIIGKVISMYRKF